MLEFHCFAAVVLQRRPKVAGGVRGRVGAGAPSGAHVSCCWHVGALDSTGAAAGVGVCVGGVGVGVAQWPLGVVSWWWFRIGPCDW